MRALTEGNHLMYTAWWYHTTHNQYYTCLHADNVHLGQLVPIGMDPPVPSYVD